MIGAEPITGPVAYHGEGRSGQAEDVAGQHVTAPPPERGRRAAATSATCISRGRDGDLTTLDELWTDPGVRMNGGACDPHGRFYCGSMAYDKRPGAATVHRLDPDRSTSVVLEGVTVSNGLDWRPDGARAYYNDTDTHRTDVFDYAIDTGLANRRPFVRHGEGLQPDGLTVDADGGIWVAMNGAGAVHRYSAELGVRGVPVREFAG